MNLSNFVAYVKQAWKNKPDTSTPLSAERLTHLEEGIKGNNDFIKEIADAVVSQIVNDPNKIASMAALYAVNQKIGDTSKLPAGTMDAASAIAQLYSNIDNARSLAMKLFNGKSSIILGNVDNTGSKVFFQFPLYVQPSRISFPANSVNLVNCAIEKVSSFTINDDAICVIINNKYEPGIPVTANIIWYFD